jgi:hypothetical protein
MCLDYLSKSVDVNVKYGYKVFDKRIELGKSVYTSVFQGNRNRVYRIGETYQEEVYRNPFTDYKNNFIKTFFTHEPYFRGFHSYLILDEIINDSSWYSLVKVELINVVEQGIQAGKSVIVSKGIKLIEEIEK